MFERVLLPTDFSRYSQRVLECVKELPGAKSVVLLHVIGLAGASAGVWNPGGKIDEASAKLSKQEKFLEGGSFDVKTRVAITEEDISKAIQRIADEKRSSVIVMGARGKGIVEGILLGNVAKNVLRNGNTNLLLMRYKILEGRSGTAPEKVCSRIFSKVLCPTDLSKTADEMIAFVERIPGVEEILLQHVVSTGETRKEVESHIKEASSRLNAIRKGLEKAVTKVNIHVSVGNPAEEIIALAKKEDVSMIAMSSHGKDWLKELVVGSTTYEVARMGDRPVLVVRTALYA